MPPRTIFHYERLAGEIEAKIKNGVYRPGEKLPSIRDLNKRLPYGISTIYRAYVELEVKGLIEARPKSGYYVTASMLGTEEIPAQRNIFSPPREVVLSAMVKDVVAAINDPAMLPLGSSVTAPELLPHKHFGRILKGWSSKEIKGLAPYPLTEGTRALRRQIALRTMGLAEGIGPDDVIVTNGCLEAVFLSLMATVRPGETVVLESPTFFAFLQMLKELGLLVIEAPTDPRHGVDLDHLARILDRHPVKACLFVPNFQNPLGCLMPEERKMELMDLLNHKGVPLIEDDISSELFFGDHRPRPARAYDRNDQTLTCSSFSKTLAPGLRVGWVIPGSRYKEKILNLKASISVASSSLGQNLASEYLASGAYDRHVRVLKEKLKAQTMKTTLAVRKNFPSDIKMAQPQGGPLLWVELNEKIDGLAVYRRALERNISILPGGACSSSGQYRHCIRIGCGFPFSPKVEQGIVALGRIIHDLYSQAGLTRP